MTKQRLIGTTGALGLLWFTGCANPCEDDGLLQEIGANCAALSGQDGTDSDADSDSDTDEASCQNAIQDGDETDVDCGGSCGNACGDGSGCQMPEDCESGLCGPGMTCASPSCEDGFENGSETDVDCGGPDCDGCDDGDDCLEGGDCQSEICGEDGTCEAPTCDDGAQNGDETDVDCGGSCEACPTGDTCIDGSDCDTGVCNEDTGECAPATCDDGVGNGSETDVDCGGECGSTCEIDEQCDLFIDCVHLVCDEQDGTCSPPTCTDGTPNGDETDVDCGGPDCPPCDEPGLCLVDTDCESDNCDEGICVPDSCLDGVQNGNETDVDCGGDECAPCDDGDDCLVGTDCLSSTCDPGSNTCTTATCSDGLLNGEETDVDCGGPTCDGCQNGEICQGNGDCMSMLCDPVLDVCEAPTCADGLLNGDETDVDCGGPDCAPCNDGEICIDNGDCASLSCEAGVCEPPVCDDGVLNGLETDVDCGGPACDPCDDFEICLTNFDCQSMVCLNDECQPATCSDIVQNGNETDVDCGGPDCQPCDNGDNCLVGTDCVSDVCDPGTNTCAGPTCMDGSQNGDETGVDCGGATCDPCGDGGGCLIDSDCASMVCSEAGICEPPNCGDGVQNGDETDLDCGGICGMSCDPGESCLVGNDCVSAGCDPGTLTCNDLLTVTASPSCSEFAGAPVPLLAVASGGTGGPYTYAWTPNDGSLSAPNMPATDASPTGFQTYTVTADDTFSLAQDTTVVVNSSPFDLENSCTLVTADYGASQAGDPATINYDLGGTRACELGNNEFGLHLCESVTFEQTRLTGTMEVVGAGTGDNDWMGLVWGAQNTSNYYSLVWKQGQQNFFGCSTPAGVLVKRIESPDFASLGGADFYCPNDTALSTVLATPAQTLTAGWVPGQSYTVVIDFIPGQSDITITRDSDGVQLAAFTILDATFPNGFFGSTTLSQENACVGPLFGSCL